MNLKTRSDDGSVLYIGSQKVVDNDCSHGAVSASGESPWSKVTIPINSSISKTMRGQLLEWNWNDGVGCAFVL